MRFKYPVLLVCLLIAGPVFAGARPQPQTLGDNFTAADLNDMCRYYSKDGTKIPTAKFIDATTCWAYIRGVADVTDGMMKNQILNQTFCLPDNAKTDEIVQVFIKYMKNYPEQLHYPASAAIMLSLRDAFPCKR